MKNIAYISALSLCIVFLCACNKHTPGEPIEPEPLLNRLDSMRSTDGPLRFAYDANGQFKTDGEFTLDGTTYTYNSEGLVSKIVVASSAPPSGAFIEVNLNYQNGVPVSGRLRYYPYSNKVAYPYYETDSIIYKIANGKVTEIKHIDFAEYYRSNNQLIRFIPGTKSIHTLTYSGNNLTKIETALTPLAPNNYTCISPA